MNKKGISVTLELLIALILALVVFALTTKIAESLTTPIELAASREICKDTVRVHAQFQTKSFKTDPSIIQCPTSYISFSNSKTTYQYGEIKTESQIQYGKESSTIKRVMANELYNCWNQFGEGKLDLFGGPSKYCSICSVITFDDPVEVKGFYSYLMEHTVPDNELEQNGVTYFDYIQGYSKKGKYDPRLVNDKKIMEDTELDTQNPQAILFVYAKSEPLVDNTIERISKFGESAGGKVFIASVVMIGAGTALSLTGVGATVGIPVIAAGMVNIGKTFVFNSFLEGAAEAELKSKQIKDWTAGVVLGKYDENLLKDLGCETLAGSKK